MQILPYLTLLTLKEIYFILLVNSPNAIAIHIHVLNFIKGAVSRAQFHLCADISVGVTVKREDWTLYSHMLTTVLRSHL